MSRIVNPDSAGRERTRLSKAVVVAVRELAVQPDANPKARDLAAFIALALLAIADTIEASVAAWEKRGYWVKADRFRMDWAWSGTIGRKLEQAVLAEDWATVAQQSAQVAQRLSRVNVAPGHRLGAPWTGAWERMQERK